MSPAYLASRGDLYDLVKSRVDGGDAPAALRVLCGWRRKLVGEDLLGFLAGKYSLSIDSGEVAVISHQVDETG